MAHGADPFLAFLGRSLAEIDLDIPQTRGALPPWIGMLKHLLHTSYDFTRAYYDFLGAWPILRQRDPVLIYQMGKVGSSTIKKSLAALDSDRPVFQIHHLTGETIARAEAGYGPILESSYPRTKHLLWSRYLLAVQKSEPTGPPWKIITLIRDPLAVCISGFFFSHLRDLAPERAGDDRSSDADVDRLTQLFLERFGDPEAVFERTSGWFDRELKASFGFDVHAEPFERSRGYEIRRTQTAELLILTTESLERSASAAFSDFLGIRGFRIVKDNLGSEQSYGPAYRRFKDLVTLPSALLDPIYSSPFVRHFYDDAQITRFRRQWSERG